MLDLEWSKDNDTKTQCNRLYTSPLHRGNASNKNGPAWVERWMQWEVPSKPLAVDEGQVTAGDDSDKKGKMGAGYNNLRRK